MTGPVSSVLEPGPVKDRTDWASYSMGSMRALGKSDVLRMRQFAKAVLAPTCNIHRIQSILWLSGPAVRETAMVPDPALLSVERNASEHGKIWVISTSTYVKMASIATVALVVYMMYRLVKQTLHNLCLCREFDAKQEPEQTLADVVCLTSQDQISADKDKPEPADMEALEKAPDEAVDEVDGDQNDGRPSFIFKLASFMIFQLGALPAAFPVFLPRVPLLVTVSFVTRTSKALRRVGEILDSAIRKSSNCIIDALAPFVFGSLLLLTTTTGILLYGVGNVGIAKIAQSGIFGLNEDAIDTLLEMIHMQWRLMQQLKWSWWLSVAGRYESCFQYGFRHKQKEEDGEVEHEPKHAHDHHICTDPICPFRHLIPHRSTLRSGATTPETGDQETGLKYFKTKEMEAQVEAEAKTKAAAERGHHKSDRGHIHHHHHYHHARHAGLDHPKEHIKLETRRDWLRWLILGKDGSGGHYRDRHHRHNVGNSIPTDAKDHEQTPKDANPDKSPAKDAATSKK